MQLGNLAFVMLTPAVQFVLLLKLSHRRIKTPGPSELWPNSLERTRKFRRRLKSSITLTPRILGLAFTVSNLPVPAEDHTTNTRLDISQHLIPLSQSHSRLALVQSFLLRSHPRGPKDKISKSETVRFELILLTNTGQILTADWFCFAPTFTRGKFFGHSPLFLVRKSATS
jgi:hypothetical protein